MNEPIVETPINAHYKEFVSHEAEELTERLGVNCPLEMTYGGWEELIEEWNAMGISISFDIDIPEENDE
tara:strand:- start:2137 stop:2343 length:207 start_codon:yes stop_codon:yes gene_type:complete